jgi:NTE family protein
MSEVSNMHTEKGHEDCTALVMAGGGSLGAVEVGMLHALLGWGIEPAMVVGASVGAINASYFAADPTLDGVDRLRALWCDLRRRDVFPLTFGSIFGLLGRRDHLVSSDGLRHLLERHLLYRRLEDAALPVHVVASDMLSGDEVRLSSGPVVDAVLASTAIPGVFPPVRLADRLLVDGGVANNTPISTAISLGATRVIVLPTGFACALSQIPSGAIARAMHALSLLVSRQLVRDAERFAGGPVQLRIVPGLCPLSCSPYDYSAAASLIDRARASTEAWLEQGGLEEVSIPASLREHHHGSQ